MNPESPKQEPSTDVDIVYEVELGCIDSGPTPDSQPPNLLELSLLDQIPLKTGAAAMAGGGMAGTAPNVLALPAPQSTEPENKFDVVLGHRCLRVNSVEILQNCQILQGRKAQMDVPLYRMISLQVVRLALAMDIEKMKADFIHGYRPRAAVFYLSTTNIQGTERTVSDENCMSWNAHWRRKNVEFEEFLNADPELHFFSNKMFYVYDGNHKLVAWTEFIHKAHPNDLDWHFQI